MARSKIPLTVITRVGNAVEGASVTIDKRSGGAATVYDAESGGSVVAQPLATDIDGRASGWVERGRYTATITSGLIATYTEHFDASVDNEDTRVEFLDTNTIVGLGTTPDDTEGLGTIDRVSSFRLIVKDDSLTRAPFKVKFTYPESGNVTRYRPFSFWNDYKCTTQIYTDGSPDGGTHADGAYVRSQGLTVRTFIGGGLGPPVLARGAAGVLSLESIIRGSYTEGNEAGCLFAFVRDDTALHAGSKPARLWLMDLGVQGTTHATMQNQLLLGISLGVNQYKADKPAQAGSVNLTLGTKPNSFPGYGTPVNPPITGTERPHIQDGPQDPSGTLRTYPLDYCLNLWGWSGRHDESIVDLGYKTALLIGGDDNPWMHGTGQSRIGTGIEIRDVQAGIKLWKRLAGSTGYLLQLGLDSSGAQSAFAYDGILFGDGTDDDSGGPLANWYRNAAGTLRSDGALSAANFASHWTAGGQYGFLQMREQTAAVTAPAANDRIRVYMKNNKLIVRFVDGSTDKFFTLNLAGTSGSWAYETSEP